jgi:hypothetical protein
MKARRARNLSARQAQDLLVGLQMCAGGSEYLVPGRYNFRKPLSNAALNSLIDRPCGHKQRRRENAGLHGARPAPHGQHAAA